MAPLKTSTEVEGMLSLFKYVEENEDRSVGQEKSGDKEGRKKLSQELKDRWIGGRRQKQNDSRRARQDFEEDEKDKIELEP